MAEIKDNVIQLQEVHKKLNITVGETIALLEKGSLAVDKYNKSLTNVPSQYISQMKNVKTSVDNVTVSTDKLVLTSKQMERQSIKESSARNSLNKQREKEVATNEKLSGAYNQLSSAVAKASMNYQNIMVRGRLAEQSQRQYNAELRKAQREFQVLQARVLQADKAVGKWNRTGERSIGFAKNLAGAFGLVGGVYLFAQIARDVFQTTKEIESLDKALKQVTDTQENFANQQAFLRDISEAFGLEINSLTKQFTQFYVSAKDKISSDEIQGIFRSVSKAGAVMGLSVQQQERAFLALNQMMSKGTIQAEELRGQLGEALPGAFGIMAKAVGVTEKRLAGMMKAGELLASDVLPKFAKQLEKTYGIETINRVETLTSKTIRFQNAWTDFVRSLNESETGGLSSFFGFLSDSITNFVVLLKRANTEWNTLFKQAGASGQAVGNKFFDDFMAGSTGGNLSPKQRKLVKARIEELKNLLKAGYNDPEIQKEINDLYSKLGTGSREDVAQSLLNQSTKQIDIQENKLKKLNAELENYWGLTRSPQAVKSEIEATTKELGKWQQVQIRATKAVYGLEEAEKSEIDTTKKLTKAKEKQNEIYKIGTEKWIREQISELRSLQETNDTTTESYKLSSKTIEFYEQWLERLKGTTKETKDEIENLGVALDLSDDVAQTEGAFEDFKKVADDYAKTFKDDFIGNAGLTTFFDILEGNIQGFGSNWKTTTLAIMEATQEMFNFIETLSNNSFELEKSMLDDQYSYRMELANGNAEAEKRLSEEKERREKEILNREAKAKKKLAIFNIAINTAQAIVSALPNIPLAITIGAIGLAQGIAVASQEVPQYWKGTENAKEGWAYTQEKGAEIITDSKGNIKDMGSNDGAKLTYMKRGDKVKTAYQTKDLINKMAMDSLSLSLPQQKQQNTFTKEDLSKEFSKLAKEFRNRKGANVNVVNKIENSRVNLKSQIV